MTPEEEQPPAVPGAVLRVELDPEHLLAAGFPDGTVDALVNSRRIFSPLKLDKGSNVGVYRGTRALVQSGFVLKASREQMPGKAYLMVQRARPRQGGGVRGGPGRAWVHARDHGAARQRGAPRARRYQGDRT